VYLILVFKYHFYFESEGQYFSPVVGVRVGTCTRGQWGDYPPAAAQHAASHHELLQCTIAVQHVAAHNETGCRTACCNAANYAAMRHDKVSLRERKG